MTTPNAQTASSRPASAGGAGLPGAASPPNAGAGAPAGANLPGAPAGANLPGGPAGRPAAPSDDGYGPDFGRPSVTIASYPDYPSAQRTVDYLADNRFPVENTAIVGTNLTLVETVLGRMTVARAALAGAGTGAWFGLFIGLLFGIFTVGNWLTVILAGLVIGAVWGAIFGAVAHAMTGGRRDFSSASSLRASEYAVTVDADFADDARNLLARMNWQPGRSGQPGGAGQPGQPGGAEPSGQQVR